MKVLFYVEPFVIRNNPSYFYGYVCENFYGLAKDKLLQKSFDTRLFVNLETFDNLKTKKKLDADANKNIIIPSDKYKFLTKKYSLCWENDGINTWIQLMKGEGEVSQDYMSLLSSIWNEFPFDVIIHWGENGAITKFCNEYSITHIGMELGCCRKPFFDSIIMDLFGTNGNAIIPQLDINQIKEIVSDNYMSKNEALFLYSDLDVSGYKNQFDLLPNSLLSNLDFSKKIAYIPLQLHDDANLLNFSKYNTIKDVVMDVVPKLIKHNYQVIIKYHPASSKRAGSVNANKLSSFFLEKYRKDVILLDINTPSNIDNSQLFSISDLVITVNSSTGFEALYFDKVLVVLGDAVYKPKNLFPNLDEVLENKFDKKAYLHNIGILRRFVLEGYLEYEFTIRNHKIFFERIKVLDNLNRQCKKDAFEIASNYYKYKSMLNKSLHNSIFLDGENIIDKRNIRANSLLDKQNQINQKYSENSSDDNIIKQVVVNLFNKFNQPTQEVFRNYLYRIFTSKKYLQDLIVSENILDANFYLKEYPDVKESNLPPQIHYIEFGINENRKPRNNLSFCSINDILNRLLVASDDLFINNSSDQNDQKIVTDNSNRKEEFCKKQLREIYTNLQKLKNENKKLVVVLHLFYKDIVDEILEYLNNIPFEFDVIASVPNYGNKEIIQKVISKYPNSQILITHKQNSGRDIEPFIKILPVISSLDYKYVLKLQTKKGYFNKEKGLLIDHGNEWRREILQSLVGSCERVKSIFSEFEDNDNLNMVGTKMYYFSLKTFPYSDDGILAKDLLKNPVGEGFFAGTMFWSRVSCLKPLESLFFKNFIGNNLNNDNNTCHIIERLFGQCASTINNGQIAVVTPDLSSNLVSYNCIPNEESIHRYLTLKVNEYLSTKYVMEK